MRLALLPISPIVLISPIEPINLNKKTSEFYFAGQVFGDRSIPRQAWDFRFAFAQMYLYQIQTLSQPPISPIKLIQLISKTQPTALTTLTALTDSDPIKTVLATFMSARTSPQTPDY